MRVGVLNEFIYFWSFSITLIAVVFSRLYGFGLGNVAAFVCYMIFIIFYTKGASLRKINFGPVMRLALMFFILAVGSIVIQNQISGSMIDRHGFNTYDFAINNLMITFIYFLFGTISVFSSRNLLRKKGIFLVFFTLLFVWSVGKGVLDYEEISSRLGMDVSQIEISQSFVVLVLLSLAYSRKYKTTVIVMGSILLFLAGSRTAFFVGLASMLFYGATVGSVSRRVTTILGASLSFLFSLTFIDIGSNSLISRMLMTEGIEADRSAQSRMLQFDSGFSMLREQILIGDMNFVVTEFGGIGFYIHNIFGYWQQYGSVVFFVVCIIIFAIFRQAKKDYVIICSQDNPFLTFRVLMFFYSFLSLMLAMSYTFKFFWFAVGLYCVGERYKGKISFAV